MSYKNICVHVAPRPHCEAGVKMAFELAERFDAHVSAVFVDPLLMSSEPSGVAPIPSLFASIAMEVNLRANEARSVFDGIAAASPVRAVWQQASGSTYSALCSSARYSDLLVLNQRADADVALILDGDVNSVLLETGRPVLVVPAAGADTPVHGKALVAWNGSREAARAVNDAMPLLKLAKQVRVVGVQSPGNENGDGCQPGAQLCFYLSTHGVRATVEMICGSDTDSGDLLLAYAAEYGANLIVAGAYGHSRLRELVLGGVTLKLLRHTRVPVLMSH